MFDLQGEVQAVDAGQGDRLIRRRLKEEASAGRGRAMTKRKQQDTGYPRHRLPTLLRVEMYPDGGVSTTTSKPVPASQEAWEVREVVVDPFTVGGRM